MESQVKIPDTSFVRDIHSKAILNTDKKGLNDYLLKKEIAKKQSFEADDNKKRLALIEQEMSEIKQLLLDLKSMRTINGN
jgi:hypothetical protein